MRRDIVEIVAEIPKFKEISMVTNGYLSNYADELKEVGLDRVNVSLDTLDSEYKFITGVKGLEKVLNGIESAYNVGLTPIKVNMVVMKDLNDGEVYELLEFTSFNRKGINVILQLIEVICDKDERYYVSLESEERFRRITKAVIWR